MSYFINVICIPRGIRVAWYLVFCVVFYRSLFVLLVVVLYVILWFMNSNCPFGIFKLNVGCSDFKSYNSCSIKSRFSDYFFYSFHIWSYVNLYSNKVGHLVLSYHCNSKSYNKYVAIFQTGMFQRNSYILYQQKTRGSVG